MKMIGAEIIDAYLEEDGEEISVKGFYDWFEDDDQLMAEPNIEALNETIADLQSCDRILFRISFRMEYAKNNE